MLPQKQHPSLAVIFDKMVERKCKAEHLIAVKCNSLTMFQAKCITAETDKNMQMDDVQMNIKFDVPYLKRCEFMAMLSWHPRRTLSPTSDKNQKDNLLGPKTILTCTVSLKGYAVTVDCEIIIICWQL